MFVVKFFLFGLIQNSFEFIFICFYLIEISHQFIMIQHCISSLLFVLVIYFSDHGFILQGFVILLPNFIF